MPELRPFVFWDGEGCANEKDPEDDYRPYCLLGSSEGLYVSQYDVSTLNCLELLIETEKQNPTAIHTSFAFGYDTNNIIKDLPIGALRNLKTSGRTRYRGFSIEYIPHKWIQVGYGRSKARGGNGRISLKIFDVFSFFATRFDVALKKYGIGSESDIQRISAGKGERQNFVYADFRDRREPFQYWKLELKYGVELCDKFREILYAAGYYITSWHGAGAIASYCLRNHSFTSHMDPELPREIIEASRSAYIGGRFNPFKVGYHEGPIYSADINTAYGYTFSRLPSLANGKWLHTEDPDREDTANRRMGLYHIRYLSPNTGGVKPLPHRDPDGTVSWPPMTEGWFHASEAYLVRKDPNAQFLEAYIFEDDGSYPFAWIRDIYQDRLDMQAKGDWTELAHKKAIASFYGQVAQRAGWERRNGPPRFHQLEIAGAITAECRSLVYSAARSVGEDLISIDTDGVLASRPFPELPNGTGIQLGQWKLAEYTGIFYIQSGVYWLRDGEGNWLPPKSRGIPRRKLNFSDIWIRTALGENPIKIQQHQFLGFGLAIRGRMNDWRKWLDAPRSIAIGGTGKSVHSPRYCPECVKGRGFHETLHPLIPILPKQLISRPHHIPWLEESRESEMREVVTELERYEVV
jgi:DNA polymerase type B, organellar and viral